MTETEKKYLLKKAKTHKGRLHIKQALPKLIEDPKNCALINTNNSSEIMRLAMDEIYTTRKSFTLKLNKKNILGCAFDTADSVEYLCQKNNCGMFFYTTDTKKRPMNLVFGNLFSAKILDMFEFEVTNFIPVSYFPTIMSFEPNSQPIMLFIGEQFETDKNMERFKKFMMDFYKQDSLEEINITDLKRIIVFCVNSSNIVQVRNYQTNTNSEYSLNNIALEETGPSFDLKPRRQVLASDDEYKLACKKPVMIKGVNKKNRINSLLDVKGKIFATKQNLQAASLKRYDKILGRKRKTNQDIIESDRKIKEASKSQKKTPNVSKGRSRSKKPEEV